jgi:hypothetical protein
MVFELNIKGRSTMKIVNFLMIFILINNKEN